MQVEFDQEKSRMLRDFQSERDALTRQKDSEIETLREALQRDISEVESRSKDRQNRDAKVLPKLLGFCPTLRIFGNFSFMIICIT